MDRGAGQAPTEKDCWSIWRPEGAKLLRTGLPLGDLIFLSNLSERFSVQLTEKVVQKQTNKTQVLGCELRGLISNPRCATLPVWCWATHFIHWTLLSSWIEPRSQSSVTWFANSRADRLQTSLTHTRFPLNQEMPLHSRSWDSGTSWPGFEN